MFDLTGVQYVKRIVIGSSNPAKMRTEEEIEQATELLNRCLSDSPKGHIIGIEKNFTVLQAGEHQVVLQWITYHVGFSRKPFWLSDENQ